MTKTSQKLTPKTAAQPKLRSASPPATPPASTLPPGQPLLNGDADASSDATPTPLKDLIRHAIALATPAALQQRLNLTHSAIASWAANRKTPWQYLTTLAELTGIDLKLLMDANAQADTQAFRGTERPLELLKDLAELEQQVKDVGVEVNAGEALQNLATKHNIKLHLLKIIWSTSKGFQQELQALSRLNQQFPDKAAQREALQNAAATLNISIHEVNRRLRRWGITPPPLESVQARRLLQGRRQINKERLAIATALYTEGKRTIEEAAILGETSPDYLYRIARQSLGIFGETLRDLRKWPTYVRTALAVDVAQVIRGDADNQALYSDEILRLYRKVGMNKARPLSTAFQQSFQDLLPAVIRDEIDLPTLAAFKEITPDLLKQRFTGLLTPHGLTWAAIERMSHAHKEALYQLLIRVPAG